MAKCDRCNGTGWAGAAQTDQVAGIVRPRVLGAAHSARLAVMHRRWLVEDRDVAAGAPVSVADSDEFAHVVGDHDCSNSARTLVKDSPDEASSARIAASASLVGRTCRTGEGSTQVRPGMTSPCSSQPNDRTAFS